MLEGSLHRLRIDSKVLADNPLGDPARRELPVYLPPGREPDEAGELPLILVLAGYGGRGEAALGGTPWDPGFPERYERLLAGGQAAPCAFAFPDAFTRLGGSQYMNSSATGRYRDHLVTELLPAAEERFGVGGDKVRRGLMGKSSGGFGSLHLSCHHPDVFGALASHAGDCGFDLVYRSDFKHLLSALDRYGDVPAFLAAFEAAPDKGPLFGAMSILAMASCYSPDAGEPLGIALPFEPRTGRLREDVWDRWLEHDPVRVAAGGQADALRDARLVWIDAGTRDEYLLQYGNRQLVAALQAREIPVVHEEFDGGHRGVSYRYDRSLPAITRALSV